MAALRMRSELAALHILDHALTQRGLRNRHGKLLRGVANPMILRRRRARRYLRSLDWLPHSRLQHPAKRVSPQRFSAMALCVDCGVADSRALLREVRTS